MNQWEPDVLGAGFESLTIELEAEDDGPLVATLVRSLPAPRGRWARFIDRGRLLENVDVLYVHGWNDYFFQKRTAAFFTDRGARFFALDLRRYGRSLREGQTPGYIENLVDYDVEIERALHIMGHASPSEHGGNGAHGEHGALPGGGSAAPSRRLLLTGHSTGGLVLSLWSHRNRGVAHGLLLNSPWLALQVGGAARRALMSVVNLRARFAPRDLALPQIDLGFYQQAQQQVSDPDEQALVNELWRAPQSPPVLAGWLKAILAGHSEIAARIDVGAPVCVMLSDRSMFGLAWRDEMAGVDTVIDVEKVSKAALKLGNEVTVVRVPGALHNVFLSRPEIAEGAYTSLDRWLRGWAASLAE